MAKYLVETDENKKFYVEAANDGMTMLGAFGHVYVNDGIDFYEYIEVSDEYKAYDGDLDPCEWFNKLPSKEMYDVLANLEGCFMDSMPCNDPTEILTITNTQTGEVIFGTKKKYKTIDAKDLLDDYNDDYGDGDYDDDDDDDEDDD